MSVPNVTSSALLVPKRDSDPNQTCRPLKRTRDLRCSRTRHSRAGLSY